MNGVAVAVVVLLGVAGTGAVAWWWRRRTEGAAAERMLRDGLQQLSDREAAAALQCFDRVLASRHPPAAAQFHRAVALQMLGRLPEALAGLDLVLACDTRHVDALYKRGTVLLQLGQPAEAVAAYDAALSLQPHHVDALYNRAIALQGLCRDEESIRAYDRVLELQPDDADALNNLGNAWSQRKRSDRALAHFSRAVAVRPDFVAAWHNLGLTLQALQRPDEAAEAFARVLALAPGHPYARGRLLHAKMMACDWRDFESLVRAVDDDVRRGHPSIDPFAYLAVARAADDQRRCASRYGAEYAVTVPGPVPPPDGERRRIRVGYLSGEFRHQATSILMVQFFESVDRKRFEQVAFDNGFDDGSDIRCRLVAAFDEIVDISRLDDAQAAQAVRQRHIDILVDLSGYFGLARPGVLARRAAPIQVGYLGFPGTLGTSWMDYLLADRHVVPSEQAPHYTECVVHLPDSYQANDRHRPIAPIVPERVAQGLPATGFVYCCFNNSFKITPEVFGVWMRLLAATPGSVLWLLEGGPASARNLCAEAGRAGVDPSRLVFAPRQPLDRHLARHGCADLFLDTLPCNAHTTASDALWAGLPVLTCAGGTFAGRVAASLLHAVGLPELVTTSLSDYESLALELARSPRRIDAFKATLARQRDISPLFDARRLCRHVERAYETMWWRWQRGEPPAAFAVDPIDAPPLND